MPSWNTKQPEMETPITCEKIIERPAQRHPRDVLYTMTEDELFTLYRRDLPEWWNAQLDRMITEHIVKPLDLLIEFQNLCIIADRLNALDRQLRTLEPRRPKKPPEGWLF